MRSSPSHAPAVRLRLRICLVKGKPGYERLYNELVALAGDHEQRQHIMRILMDYSRQLDDVAQQSDGQPRHYS